MGHISDVQLANINESCGNGFQLNVQEYIINDRIEFVKYRDVDDSNRVVYKMHYGIKHKHNKYRGKNYGLITTKRYIVIIKATKWIKPESLNVWIDSKKFEFITSYDWVVDRKSIKFLTKLTHVITDEVLDELSK